MASRSTRASLMRRARGLFSRLGTTAHIDAAVSRTVRGKRRRPDVAWMLFRRGEVVARLAAELAEGRWRAGGFELVRLRDPKPRVIARASIEDRVVHGALAALIEESTCRSWAPEDFACRSGFGAHRGLLRLLELTRRFRFAVHLDVRAYFPSIDRARLRHVVERFIDDSRFLDVLDQALAAGGDLYQQPEVRRFARLPEGWPPHGCGVPIGASTSQVLAAHVYLNALDYLVKRTWRVPGYLRYVDDFFLFSDSRAELRQRRADLNAWLGAERGLRLKHPEARVLSCRGHLDALGKRVTRDGIAPLPRAVKRLARRAGAQARGQRGLADLERSMASSVGVIMF